MPVQEIRIMTREKVFAPSARAAAASVAATNAWFEGTKYFTMSPTTLAIFSE